MPRQPTRKPSRQTSGIYQIKVTLRYTSPPIWRRLLVPSEATLADLHEMLQLAMPWYDSHLHQFQVRETYYGPPSPFFVAMPLEDETENERKTKLSEVAPTVKSKFVYVYDLGDTWEHLVLVEKILLPEPGQQYPVCLAGKRACPPEDCGGAYSYPDFLEAIRDPKHPDHAEMLEWVGGRFDPEEFDRELVNKRLAAIAWKAAGEGKAARP